MSLSQPPLDALLHFRPSSSISRSAAVEALIIEGEQQLARLPPAFTASMLSMEQQLQPLPSALLPFESPFIRAVEAASRSSSPLMVGHQPAAASRSW